MKKLTIAAAVVLALCGLAGCHRNQNGTTGTAANAPSTSTAENNTSSAATSANPAAPSQNVATSNAAGTPAGANVPGQATGATSPGDYGNYSNNASTTTTAMGAGAAGGHGQTVYSQTCAACHAAGIAGAPKLGDKADWGPRIAQGTDVLYTHALQGFTGKKGTMPPKGGNTTIADADVKAAVDYMVAQAK